MLEGQKDAEAIKVYDAELTRMEKQHAQEVASRPNVSSPAHPVLYLQRYVSVTTFYYCAKRDIPMVFRAV